MEKRLVSRPVFDVKQTIDERYKASIMMIMDCETRPFSTVTLVSSVAELQSYYGTDKNNLSYRMAEKLLATNKVCIYGINPVTNENIRTTLAVYDFDDRIIAIHPSYSVLSTEYDVLGNDNEGKSFTLYFDKYRMHDDCYFKIYYSLSRTYMFAVINADHLNDKYEQMLIEGGSINDMRQLIDRHLGVPETKYLLPIVVFIHDEDSDEDIKFKIYKALIDNDIKYEADLTYEYYIRLNAIQLNGPVFTSLKYKIDTKQREIYRRKDYTLDDYDNQWYAYRLKIHDINQNFYFKTYYTKQNSLLFFVINADTIADELRQKLHNSVADRNAALLSMFHIDRNYFTHIVMIETHNDMSISEYEQCIQHNLRTMGVLYEMESYYDERGEYTRYLTLYSHKIHDVLMTNLDMDLGQRKSYDIDFIMNYERMLFSAWRKQSSLTENIRLTVTRANDRHTIIIENIIDNDVVDIETYTCAGSELQHMINMLNINSKYVEMRLYSDHLPAGTWNLRVFNVDTNVYDESLRQSFEQIDSDFMLMNNVDILYNTRDDMKTFDMMMSLVNQCDKRVLMMTDAIDGMVEVDRFDLSNITCSDEINKNLESDRLLKDDKQYKRFWLIYDKYIFALNDIVIPEEYIENDYEPVYIKSETKTISFSEALAMMNKEYRRITRSKLIDLIEQMLSSVVVESVYNDETGEMTDLYLGNKVSIEDATNDDYIVMRYHITNSRTKVRSYNDLATVFGTWNVSLFELRPDVPKWSYDAEVVSKIKVNRLCMLPISSKYDCLNIMRRSYDDEGYDSTFRLLMSIFNDNAFEFDTYDRLELPVYDNHDQFVDSLATIYKSSLHNNAMYLNEVYDNEYYYSVLNPNATYLNYRVPLLDLLPALLQINHTINSIFHESTEMQTEDACNDVMKRAIAEVATVVNAADTISLVSFNKIERTVYLRLRLELSYSTKLSYDFAVTVNI